MEIMDGNPRPKLASFSCWQLFFYGIMYKHLHTWCHHGILHWKMEKYCSRLYSNSGVCHFYHSVFISPKFLYKDATFQEISQFEELLTKCSNFQEILCVQSIGISVQSTVNSKFQEFLKPHSGISLCSTWCHAKVSNTVLLYVLAGPCLRQLAKPKWLWHLKTFSLMWCHYRCLSEMEYMRTT